MRYLLDSTLLIDHANRDEAAAATLARFFEEGHELYTCDIVTTEVLSYDDPDDLRHLEMLLDALEYVATTPTAARWAAASRRSRHRAGGLRALGDAIIAGVAVDLDATVVTRNADDFVRQGVPVFTY